MNLSERDRKIAMVILPVLLLAVYWFLMLAPKREAAAKASKAVAEQTERRDAARAQAEAARGAQTDFASDYGEIVRLGKAIPSGVDMPSLIVQIDRAAAGTGIRFTRMATGARAPVVSATPAPTGTEGTTPTDGTTPAEGTTPADGATPAADAGGAPAQTAPGSAVESANNTAQTAAQSSDAATQSGVDTQTSTSTGSGGLPVGGGAAPTAPGAPASSPAGLETVPLELEFVGNFFNLADFFHDIKRFVRVANNNVLVSGRLITVDSVRFASEPELFPRIRAEVTATVYLSPKAEGTTAGATPQGPAPAAPGTETTPTTTPPSSSPAPTATATP
jgi:Tfp pilus assembly protein PilO